MAAFSSLALLGLGLAGGFAASKVAGRNRQAAPEQSVTAQQQPTVTPPPAPAPAPQVASESTKIAQRAGQKQRRKGVPVSTTQPVRSSIVNPSPILQPQSLLGF